MKGKRKFLVGIILGTLFGWFAAFFYSPISFNKVSFLLGFIGGLIFISFGIALLILWNKQSSQVNLKSKKLTIKNFLNSNRLKLFNGILSSILVAFVGIVGSFLILKQNTLVHNQTAFQNKSIKQQSMLVESVRQGNLVFLMRNILDKVDDELKQNPKRVLSDETIARIAALSYSFKPYQYIEGDSLSEKKFSPERGQLLLTLSKMNIADSSFEKIIFKTPFSNVDLSGANLRNANLQEIDFREANLSEADLRNVNLQKAEMVESNLWGANLRNANLSGASLKKANLKWADLKGSQLEGTNLDGADLSYAKLSTADLSEVKLQYATLNGASLNEVNLEGVKLFATVFSKANLQGSNLKKTDLRWADLSEANLKKTNLSKANLRRANLSHADLSGADLSGANLGVVNLSGAELHRVTIEEENWFEKLKEWEVIGVEKIKSKYKIIKDKSGNFNYYLEKINETHN